MKDLMGNGQPGRIATIEKQIMSQQKTLWIGVGILSALQVLHANGMLNLGNLFRASQTQDQPAAIHQVVK
jgi:hypothetical protein